MEFKAGSYTHVIKGKMWWRSVWPLFLISLLMTFVANASGLNGMVGVGGLGALVLGSILSASFVKRPVFTIREAFLRGLFIGGIFHVLVGAVFMCGPTSYDLQRMGYDHGTATSMALRSTAFQIAIQLPVLSITWAFAVVSKAKSLVTSYLAGGGAPAAEPTDTAPAAPSSSLPPPLA